MKNNLKDFNRADLQNWVKQMEKPGFTGTQIFTWLHRHLADSAEKMTNVSKDLRAHIGKTDMLVPVRHENHPESMTEKFLFECYDGSQVESVLIKNRDRRTICVSSQIGCAMNCTFCQTAKMGFIRNLTPGEIVDQVILISRLRGSRPSNVVFMGMGEPFNNYENVIKAAYMLNDKKGLNIGARHITLSTCGIIPGINRLACDEIQFKLAVSLNAPNNDLRKKLMPLASIYSLEELMDSLTKYYEKKNKLITFEYVLLKDINDQPQHAEELADLLYHIPCKVNLIPYNETDGQFERPGKPAVQLFHQILEEAGNIAVTVRNSGGQGINAACGQLYSETLKHADVNS